MSDALPKLYSEDEVAAAVAAEREACAVAAEVMQEDLERAALRENVRSPYHPYPYAEQAEKAGEIAAAIRARASGGDALAEHTARVRREALEEAAGVADFLVSSWSIAAGVECAAAIRALIGGDDAAG